MSAVSRSWSLARWLLGAALLGWVLRRLDLPLLGEILAQATGRPGWMALTLALTVTALLAGAWRWHRILRALGYEPGPGTTVRWLFIGQFFNVALPGSCGGDAIRAWLASRDQPGGRRMEAVTSVIADRLLGLLLTILVAVSTIWMPVDWLEAAPWIHTLRSLALLILAGTLAALLTGMIVIRNSSTGPGLPILRAHEERIERLKAALGMFLQRPALLIHTLLLSALNLLLLTAACHAFARALGLPLQAMVHGVLFPWITLLAAIPITPGGLGLREGLYVGLYQHAGISPEQALGLSLGLWLAGFLVSLAGAVFYLQGRRATSTG